MKRREIYYITSHKQVLAVSNRKTELSQGCVSMNIVLVTLQNPVFLSYMVYIV